jgi:phosphoserine phosphatase
MELKTTPIERDNKAHCLTNVVHLLEKCMHDSIMLGDKDLYMFSKSLLGIRLKELEELIEEVKQDPYKKDKLIY